MSEYKSPNFNNPEPEEDDGMTLQEVIHFFLRNRILLGIITSLSAVFGAIYAFRLPPKWEGSFQIVVAAKQENPMMSTASSFINQAALLNSGLLRGMSGGESTELQTEIKILESPSVLRPVYEFASEQKKLTEENNSPIPEFKSWFSQSVSIDLIRRTKVLTISYKDSDKKLILPVLNKMKDIYQQYSNLERLSALSRGIEYASTQVQIFKERSEKSNRLLDSYEIRHGIKSDSRMSGSGFTNPNFLQIDNPVSPSSFMTTTSSSAADGSRSGDPISDLSRINREILRRKRIFTDEDPSMKALIRERDAVRTYVELSAGGTLASPSGQPSNKEEAQKIMVKYKELFRKAERESKTLDSLESMLLNLQLSKARSTAPWKLISDPTLVSDSPVEPHKKMIVLIALSTGLVLGTIIVLINELIKGKVFLLRAFVKALPCPLLQELPLLDPSCWRDTLAVIVNGPIAKAGNGPIALIPLGGINPSHLKVLSSDLKELIGNREFFITPDVNATNNCSSKILVASPGLITYDKLNRISKQLALQESTTTGWLWIDPYAKP